MCPELSRSTGNTDPDNLGVLEGGRPWMLTLKTTGPVSTSTIQSMEPLCHLVCCVALDG